MYKTYAIIPPIKLVLAPHRFTMLVVKPDRELSA
jgi:hypothetical protein